VKKNSFKKYLILFSLTGLLAGLALGVTIGWIMRSLPPVELLLQYKPATQTVVLDDEGNLIGRYYQERRLVLKHDEIPEVVINSLLAAEDQHFFQHGGFDKYGIARAVMSNLKARTISEGGSTITQQVARLMFLTTERTFTRKIKEAILTFQIERRFSKDEIITIYLNQSCFGHGAFGIESAAQTFYSKSAKSLNVAESALLVSLLKNPSLFSPIKNPQQSRESRNRVLKRMFDLNYITEEERRIFSSSELNLDLDIQQGFIAPYFVEEIRRLLEKQIGKESLVQNGLTIRSTLNYKHQEAANLAIRNGLDAFIQRHPESAETIQAALVSLRPDTGDVTAMVGGSSFKKTQFNRVIQAKRQPGSAIKPFLYLSALMKGFTPSSIILDTPYEYRDSQTGKIWRPGNYDQKFRGPVTLRQSLEQSLNVTTAKLAEKIGLETFLNTIKQAGIESPLPPYPSTALGAGEVTLMELVNGYGTIASGGIRVHPRMIYNVTDRNGRQIFEQPVKIHEVFDPISCYQLTRILEGAVEHGTGWRARALNRPVAAKTGTTNDYTNAWFIGYVPNLVVGVWIGFDVNQSMGNGETGSRAAGPIFTEFMQAAISHEDVLKFDCPSGAVQRKVCHSSGYLANEHCPIVIEEAFRPDNQPKKFCPTHSQ